MAKIDAETLRAWLAEGKPVAVLDIRSAEDRAQWSIPGSLHFDAYTALKEGRPGALDRVAIPADRPIVTVCNKGIVSQIAAEVLQAKGAHVLSLDGGMQAWSLAWNTAEVAIPLPDVRITQVRRTGKGCLSYLVGSGDSAAVIDASVDARVYMETGRAARMAHSLRPRYARSRRPSLAIEGVIRDRRGDSSITCTAAGSVCFQTILGWRRG
jgi:rhodanese-related sulfurtransferase